ncbi:FecR family protein [Dyadobacter sp. CY323]|uniref:FecR family protein n=1 Tax=Dyadobacter sp. CY323 TaxID=2907302 RepID=UPI001F2B21D1|nr:FecR domain-containing protein [Dyadobacter sp. CY323]MCE6990199.1 FecR domain-containing protein [Dyadobacter sp. CY323]
MEPDITREIVFSYLKGNTTALQKQLIEEWAKHKENREQFFEWLYEYERINQQYPVDVKAGYERYLEWKNSHAGEDNLRLDSLQDDETPVGLLSGYVKLIAASVILVLACFVGWLLRDEILYQNYATAYGEVRKVDLPDGSKVVLNANSRLFVPRFGFGDEKREVRLSGEASFNVIHTQNHQRFIVLTDKHVNIEVLGTEFNVYARPRGTQVVLNKGKVQLNYLEGNADKILTMKPGDLVTVDGNGAANVRKTAQPANFSAWKFHRFIFENTSLSEIGIQLQEHFGTKIIIQDQALSDLTISGSFTAMDAEELLDILSEPSDFIYEKKGKNKIVILNKKLK